MILLRWIRHLGFNSTIHVSSSVSGHPSQLALILGRSPAEWISTMDKQDAISAALQLQHNACLMTSNLQVLGQYVTSLSRMSSEVMRLALFPSEVVNAVAWCPGYTVQPHRCQLWVYGAHRLAQAFLIRCLVNHLNNCQNCSFRFPEKSVQRLALPHVCEHSEVLYIYVFSDKIGFNCYMDHCSVTHFRVASYIFY